MATQQAHKKSPVYGTFGIYRWILACLVALGHFGTPGHLIHPRWAVMAFFMLSGYVACFILDNHYLHIAGGIRKFYTNRFLRVYPLYWFVCILCAILIVIFPDQANHYIFGKFKFPDTLEMWLRNLFAIGIYREGDDSLLSRLNYPLFVPIVSWTLSVEFFYWLLMPLVMKLRWFAVAFVAYGFVFHFIMFFQGEKDTGASYFWLQSSCFYFAIGYCLYKAIQKWNVIIPAWLFILAVCLFATLISGQITVNRHTYDNGGHLSIIANIIIIMYLAKLDPKQWSSSWQSVDQWLGQLSFGIYLMQIPMCLLAYALFYPEIDSNLWVRGLVILILSNVSAALLHISVERPLQKLRKRIRTGASDNTAPLQYKTLSKVS